VIHFFVTFAADASDTPIARALVELGVPHRIISREVLLRYRRRVWLVFVGLPRLMWCALGGALESLASPHPRPSDVVVNSHFEVIAFGVVNALLRRRARIHLLGFIFTRRRQPWLDALRRAYFGLVFRHVRTVICYSLLEQHRYGTIFPAAARKFRHIPYGLHIEGYERPPESVEPSMAPALSAGRSGRDYATLCTVFKSLGYPLRIVCDNERALVGCDRSPNIQVLESCYDDQFTRELRAAGMVVVPLGVGDISAGQMVALQAMAMRKPLVVTRTPTIEEYLRDGVNALLVEPGDAQALEFAVRRLREDPGLAAGLAATAYRDYCESHSMRAFVGNIIRAVTRADAANAAAALGTSPSQR
jgi:glycosyltransferase involved in cell wall biosynthesis